MPLPPNPNQYYCLTYVLKENFKFLNSAGAPNNNEKELNNARQHRRQLGAAVHVELVLLPLMLTQLGDTQWTVKKN